jgi:exodeoxyribonuclease V alpha subunit
MTTSDPIKLRGAVARITFQNPENGYTVARLDLEDGKGVTLVGSLPGVDVGDALEVEGTWVDHPRFGRQLQVQSFRSVLPSTTEGIRRYLGSGQIRGIGPALAERIVARFGERTLSIIEEEPEKLREVSGLGPKKLEGLLESWRRHRQERDLLIFLRGHDIGPGIAARIIARFGDGALAVVRRFPYRLAEEVNGIGFLTADAIARKLGLDPSSPERLNAGVRHLIAAATDEGHVFLEREVLLERADRLLEAGWEELRETLERLEFEGRIVVDGERVYLPGLHRAEVGAAERLGALLRAGPRRAEADWEALLDRAERMVGIEYAPSQREAVTAALGARVLVLTGGPGTGKTTVILGVLELAEAVGRRVALAAPTGRAAKRMGEVTGRGARTIHRLLEFNPRDGMFGRDPDRPVEADLVIVDESSMIDLYLMDRLLEALAPGTSLLLVGDVDQLPPVGVGNALRDVIESGRVPVVRLTHIFRQAEESRIVQNAHRIHAGEFPHLKPPPGRESDFYLMEEEDPEKVASLVTDLAAERLPRRYGFDPLLEIQVLAPMYRGATGANNLNRMLQERMNPPPGGERPVEGGSPASPVRFRVGDKVMQVRNNYDREVFNGDIGVVARVHPEEEVVWVRFDTLVPYNFGDLDELVLAYAITVHKSQGSEYRAVILPCTTQHYVMLQRNLLYTAITRARDLVVIVGSKRAMAIAIRNDRVEGRNSALAERIRQETGG